MPIISVTMREFFFLNKISNKEDPNAPIPAPKGKRP
jgi:hypothetical protein